MPPPVMSGTPTLAATPPPPSSDSPRALRGQGWSSTLTSPRERPRPPPMEGLQAGSAQGPSDFQKDSGPLSVLRAVPLGANGPGAPGQECTFPLIYSPAHPGLSSTGGGLRSSPPRPVPAPSSTFQSASQQRAGPSGRWDIEGTTLMFSGNKGVLLCSGSGPAGASDHTHWPGREQDAVTRGPGGRPCPPCPQRAKENTFLIKKPVHIYTYIYMWL